MRHTCANAKLAIAVCAALLTFSAAAAIGGESGNLLLNGGAEDGKGDQPSVWSAASVPADGLTMSRTTDAVHSGKFSFFISNSHKYDKPVSNNWAQEIQKVPRGKAIVASAYIKAESADAANVCVQCWDLDGKNMLAFASTPVFRGSQEWIEASTSPVTVPDETASVIVRAALTGQGKAWFDDVSLTVAEAPAKPVTQGAAAEAEAKVPEDLAKAASGRIVRAVPIAKDCMVLSYLADWAHGNMDNLGIADNDGGVRSLFAWAPQAVAAGDIKQENLRFVLALYSRETTAGPSPGKIEAYQVLKDWPENTSWKTQPQYAPTAAASFDFVPEKEWKLFDVTAVVRAEAAPGAKAYGVMLRFAAEDKSGAAKDWSGYQIVSREGIGEWQGFRPVLLIIEGPKASDKAQAK